MPRHSAGTGLAALSGEGLVATREAGQTGQQQETKLVVGVLGCAASVRFVPDTSCGYKALMGLWLQLVLVCAEPPAPGASPSPPVSCRPALGLSGAPSSLRRRL